VGSTPVVGKSPEGKLEIEIEIEIDLFTSFHFIQNITMKDDILNINLNG